MVEWLLELDDERPAISCRPAWVAMSFGGLFAKDDTLETFKRPPRAIMT